MIQLIPMSWLEPQGMRQPSPRFVVYYFKNIAWVGAAFALVYTATDWINGGRRALFNFAFEFEADLPLVNWTAWIYFSVILLFVIVPFAVRPVDIRPLRNMLIWAILTAGICFMLFPATVIWPRPETQAGWAVRTLHSVDSPVNTLPSLHVLLSTILIYFIARRSTPARIWLWPWWLAIGASTLFVHQHHILDIVSAWGIAVILILDFTYRLSPARFERAGRRRVRQS